jgi:hypothetical protein
MGMTLVGKQWTFSLFIRLGSDHSEDKANVKARRVTPAVG